jgi:hypothetical protein
MMDSTAVVDAQATKVAVWHVSLGAEAVGLSRMCGAWVLDDERDKVELLTRGRFVVATPAGIDALRSANATPSGVVDLAATVNAVAAERDRLNAIYEELPAARKKTLTPPRWPQVPAPADLADPPCADNVDQTVAAALGIARFLEELAAAWSGIESQRVARPYLTDGTSAQSTSIRDIPIATRG